MEFHQLRYFVTVAEELSFTRAAERLHVSQPGVSTALRRLERDLGVELVDRSNRHVALTTAGQDLLPRARAVLEAAENLSAGADELVGLVRGTVRLGMVAGMTWPRVFDAIARVNEQHPGLDVQLREDTSAALDDALAAGELDVGVLAWADEGRADLDHETLLTEQVAALVGVDHPWAPRAAAGEGVGAEELAGADLICLPPGAGARVALDRFLADHDLTAAVRWEVASPLAVRMLASRGLGVGVLTTSRVDPADHLVRVPLTPVVESRLVLAWRDVRRPGTAALLAALRRRG